MEKRIKRCNGEMYAVIKSSKLLESPKDYLTTAHFERKIAKVKKKIIFYTIFYYLFRFI